MRPLLAWTPATLFAIGAVFTVGIDLQRALPLREPLTEAVPVEIAGRAGHDLQINEQERTVAGVTDYLMRNYVPLDSASGELPFSVYVGYYDSQMQGKTIHSPKNCLPGAGWEALASSAVAIQTADGPVRVNRYLLQNKGAEALVLYWYQGRGRVQNNEYVVKWELLRDAALRQRSDEALVRVVVPVERNVDGAFGVAAEAAAAIIGPLYGALPE
jgi:EpsI family protein